VCADYDAIPAEFHGAEDNVHPLVHHPPKVALSHLVNSLTGASPRRLRQDFVDRIDKAAMHGTIWPPSYFARSRDRPPLATVSSTRNNPTKKDSLPDAKDRVSHQITDEADAVPPQACTSSAIIAGRAEWLPWAKREPTMQAYFASDDH
jgi:hypothetical protein